MNRIKHKQMTKKRRAKRRRSRIFGTSERPRLSVLRTLKHLSGQLIDDAAGTTICSLTSAAKDVSAEIQGKNKTEAAKVVGLKLGEKTKEKGITRVVFDVGPYRYHGRVKAFAEGVLEAGIKF